MWFVPKKSMITAASICAALSACSDAERAATPSMELLLQVERGISMPVGAGPLSSYDRHYAFADRNGSRMLVGIFLAANTDASDSINAPTIHVASDESDLPEILDGGCDVVNLLADPTALKEATLWCNGVA